MTGSLSEHADQGSRQPISQTTLHLRNRANAIHRFKVLHAEQYGHRGLPDLRVENIPRLVPVARKCLAARFL
ncbi:hypothetical protein GCM10010277_68870 [Streptomyces longisporoflavus]|nr:hypothetical protein GCM10010277_68870 [Streptomyces longisporoflavus]